MSLGAGARRDRVKGGVIRSAPSDDPPEHNHAYRCHSRRGANHSQGDARGRGSGSGHHGGGSRQHRCGRALHLPDELSPDLAGLVPPRPEELKALAARPDLATEAVCFATVMAFVDGTLDNAKLNAVTGLAATLGVKADFVDDITEVARGHLRSATAHMIRANLESLTGKPWDTDDAMPWLMPY